MALSSVPREQFFQEPQVSLRGPQQNEVPYESSNMLVGLVIASALMLPRFKCAQTCQMLSVFCAVNSV